MRAWHTNAPRQPLSDEQIEEICSRVEREMKDTENDALHRFLDAIGFDQ